MVIPEGYKKTEIGIIPDDWDVVKICDSCDLIGGGTPSKSQSDWWKGTFPWISSSDLFFNSIHKIQITRYITKEAVINSATKKCPKYSVLVVTRVGVGKVACAPCDICTSQDFTNLIPHKHDPLYLSYYMAKEMKGKTDSIQGTSIKGITSKEISETIICLPDRNEQMRIATALNDIDSLIDNLEKLVEKKKNIKQGAMQELLTGKRRLPGFDREWIKTTIDDSCTRVIVGLATSVTQYYRQSGTVLFRNLNIKPNYLDDRDILYLEESFADSNPGKVIHANDVLTVHTGYVGISCVVPERYEGALSFTTLISTTKKKVLAPQYLAYHLNSNLGKTEITNLQAGGGRNNLNVADFKKYQLIIPKDIKEQTAIVTILSDMDNEIDELEKKLAKYRCLKQGMMRELLTGHIRLIEKEDA